MLVDAVTRIPNDVWGDAILYIFGGNLEHQPDGVPGGGQGALPHRRAAAALHGLLQEPGPAEPDARGRLDHRALDLVGERAGGDPGGVPPRPPDHRQRHRRHGREGARRHRRAALPRRQPREPRRGDDPRDPRARALGPAARRASARRPRSRRGGAPARGALRAAARAAARGAETAGAGRPERWRAAATTPEYREALRDLARGAAAAALRRALRQPAAPGAAALHHPDLRPGDLERQHRHAGRADACIVAILLGFQAVLDFLRHRIFTILGARVAARLGRPVFEAAVETDAAPRRRRRGRARCATSATCAASSPAARSRCRWTSRSRRCFLVVLFLLHPVYGADRPRRRAAAHRRRASPPSSSCAARPRARTLAAGSVHAETAAAIRNAEVIAAMGMLPAVARRWRRAAGAGAREHRARPGASPRRCPRCRQDAADRRCRSPIVGAGAVLVIERAGVRPAPSSPPR